MHLRNTLFAGALFSATTLPGFSAAQDVKDPPVYAPSTQAMDLYHAFVRSPDKTSIAAVLGDAMSGGDAADAGVLILVTGEGIYGYRRADRALVMSISTRSDTANGNLEMTAVSHVGPAIAYLAELNALGNDQWRPLAGQLVRTIDAFRRVNASPDDNWLGRIDAPAWKGRHAKIRAMVDYAMDSAGRYLQEQLAGDGTGFTLRNVNDRFFDGGNDAYPIGFSNIMVATFALATLNGAHATAQGLLEAGFDWSDARILVLQKVGGNVGAGLTVRSNWTARMLLDFAGDRFERERLLIVPYADRRESIGQDLLPIEDFTYYDSAVWQSLTQRGAVANAAFAETKSIEPPADPPLPGDWDVTKADDIGGFVERLKYTFGHSTELLSNATGFWIAGALAAADWNPETVTVPGLDAGFPAGIDGYPPLAGFPATDR